MTTEVTDDDELMFEFEERAAMFQYEGAMSRQKAEEAAYHAVYGELVLGEDVQSALALRRHKKDVLLQP